jgi:hypothetical protein
LDSEPDLKPLETQELELWALSMLGRPVGSTIDEQDLADLAELVLSTRSCDFDALSGAANLVKETAAVPNFFSSDAPLLSKQMLDYYQLKRKQNAPVPMLQELDNEMWQLATVSESFAKYVVMISC